MTPRSLADFIFSNIYELRFRADTAHCRALGAWRKTFGAADAAFDASAVKTIALFFIGRIGDSILCLPTVQALRRAFPQAEIHAFVSRGVKTIWEMGDCADHFFVYDTSLYVFRKESFQKLNELKNELRRINPDLAINLWEKEWGSLFVKQNIRWRVGPKQFGNAFLYTHHYSMPGWSDNPQNGFTFADWFGLFDSLGVEATLEPPELIVSRSARKQAEEFLTRSNAALNSKLVVVHPFGSVEKRWWDISEAVRLLDLLRRYDPNSTIVLIGGKNERRATERIAFPETVVNAVGELPLETTVGLIARADLVITADSGPMHIAGALRTPTVGLFRALRNDHATTYDNSYFKPLWEDDTPACFRECDWEDCAQVPCRQMSAIKAERVFAEAVKLLTQKPIAAVGQT